MTLAKLGSYVSAAGLVGLAIYHLSISDLPGAATAFTAAIGVVTGAHSGPVPAN